MTASITASMLYNLVQCPHRLSLDLHEPAEHRDPESMFVQLLWERGAAFEQEVIQNLALPFTDLSPGPGSERERLTLEAIARGDQMIYGGRIRAGNLLGDPDLLRRQGGGYVAGDIKSGAGEEGASEGSDGRPKKHYAVQLALYTDILERIGMAAGRTPFVWDINGREVVYDLDAPPGPRTAQSLWNFYRSVLENAGRICVRADLTLPALIGACKLCHWRTRCLAHLKKIDDLSLIPALGRSRRDAMMPHVATVTQLARTDISGLMLGDKTVIPGVGASVLRRFQDRARLLAEPGARPYLRAEPRFPGFDVELFFDIETDPMRDVCYLHGFVERTGRDNGTERYVPFFAESPDAGAEREAFSKACAYVASLQPCALYFYSKYERTWWRRLRERYPDVASEAQVERFFDPAAAVDLYYDVVVPFSEWPTNDHSIKTLASFLGFKWRDVSPSGAESIEWYHRWVETGDLEMKKRILEYNEDDCRATRVLLDGIRSLERRAG